MLFSFTHYLAKIYILLKRQEKYHIIVINNIISIYILAIIRIYILTLIIKITIIF